MTRAIRPNMRRIGRWMTMQKKVKRGLAEPWQSTAIFRDMTGADMDEILRRKKKRRKRRRILHRRSR